MIETGPFAGLERNGYNVILADPPWHFSTYSEKGEAKSPQSHYETLRAAGLAELPVADLAAPDCVLVMWGISPMVKDAIILGAAWGFDFKTKGVWAKQSKTGASWHMGTGFILRGASEDFYVFTRGKPKVLDRGVRNLIVAPVREHSRKPDEMYEICERLYGDVPRLELFARQSRAGWASWGNESTRFDADLRGAIERNRHAQYELIEALAGLYVALERAT